MASLALALGSCSDRLENRAPRFANKHTWYRSSGTTAVSTKPARTATVTSSVAHAMKRGFSEYSPAAMLSAIHVPATLSRRSGYRMLSCRKRAPSAPRRTVSPFDVVKRMMSAPRPARSVGSGERAARS